MAMVLAPEFPGVDFAKLVKICLVHDLGEAVGGDVPAPEQARRRAAGVATGKGKDERRDLLTLLSRYRRLSRRRWRSSGTNTRRRRRLRPSLPRRWTSSRRSCSTPRGRTLPPSITGSILVWTGAHERPPLIAQIRAILDAETERLAERTSELCRCVRLWHNRRPIEYSGETPPVSPGGPPCPLPASPRFPFCSVRRPRLRLQPLACSGRARRGVHPSRSRQRSASNRAVHERVGDGELDLAEHPVWSERLRVGYRGDRTSSSRPCRTGSGHPPRPLPGCTGSKGETDRDRVRLPAECKLCSWTSPYRKRRGAHVARHMGPSHERPFAIAL